MSISHCSFLYNKYYEGHGTAVYFFSLRNLQKKPQVWFIINNSNFSENEGSNSIVHIGPSDNKSQLFFFKGSVFSSNQGSSLYLSNENLHIVGNVLLDRNTAEYGAGIVVSNHSTITFSENSVVTFNQNTANKSGGAIFLNDFSNVIFEGNCTVMFNNNTAKQYYGGSIFSYNNSNVVLKGNSTVQFIKT